MAQRGAPLSAYLIRQIQRLTADGLGFRRVAQALGLSTRTVKKYRKAT